VRDEVKENQDEQKDDTFGMTFPTIWGIEKIDYVLFRPGGRCVASIGTGGIPVSSMKPVKRHLLGNSPIHGKVFSGGRDGKLFPSDHLGVFIRFEGM
jgi:hypothetical protein